MTRLLSDIRDHLNSFFEQLVKRCPKTGRIVGVSRNSYWGAILFPVIGLAALLWFLVRGSQAQSSGLSLSASSRGDQQWFCGLSPGNTGLPGNLPPSV